MGTEADTKQSERAATDTRPQPERGGHNGQQDVPRPKHPFVPGPLISEPDEVVKVAAPLPPHVKK